MNIRWLITPGEPRGPWAIMTALMTFGLMTVTSPFWQAGGPLVAAVAAVFAVGLSSVLTKIVLESRK
ncbi:MAG: hypothetical protein QNI90_09710 [Dinoroseobacter sp.]|nr:hypothetical protein [Dinoroseobacter sp.]